MSRPIISLIIPIQKNTDDISLLYNSIINQTYSDYECIVVNTIGTEWKFDSVLEINNNFIVIKSNNVNDAYNFAKGDKVILLSIDEILDKDFIKDEIMYLEG